MRPTIRIQYVDTPFGEVILGSFEQKLCLCDWRARMGRDRIDTRIRKGLRAEFEVAGTDLHDRARTQLGEYFAGRRRVFDIPLLTVGTDFQNTVWQALLDIPFGETTSYAELAETIGRASAVRAVAAANGANALSIFVPCHRVVGSDGGLTGYAGGLRAKAALLELESPRGPTP